MDRGGDGRLGRLEKAKELVDPSGTRQKSQGLEAPQILIGRTSSPRRKSPQGLHLAWPGLALQAPPMALSSLTLPLQYQDQESCYEDRIHQIRKDFLPTPATFPYACSYITSHSPSSASILKPCFKSFRINSSSASIIRRFDVLISLYFRQALSNNFGYRTSDYYAAHSDLVCPFDS